MLIMNQMILSEYIIIASQTVLFYLITHVSHMVLFLFYKAFSTSNHIL